MAPRRPCPCRPTTPAAGGNLLAGGSGKRRMGSSDAASDDTKHGYPVSPQAAACSLQSLVAASPAKYELAKIVPQEKSPKVHRSFFSFRSLNCGRGWPCWYHHTIQCIGNVVAVNFREKKLCAWCVMPPCIVVSDDVCMIGVVVCHLAWHIHQ